MKKVYDVIIVGAGLAGLMAANELKPCDFLVIDSKKELGLPLRCGEGIRKDDFESLFQTSGYAFVMNKTKRIEVRLNDFKRSIGFEYLVLDRPAFEQWLGSQVKGKILFGCALDDLRINKEFVELKTTKGLLYARIVILAYGCNYKIQKRIGLVKKSLVFVPCYGGIFKTNISQKDSLYFFFDKDCLGCAWLFPKNKHVANIGVGIYPFCKQDIRKAFRKILLENKVKVRGKPSYAGIFPTNGPIQKTYSDRLLVVGDAAGQLFPGAGEGIYFALRAGQLAGRTALFAVRQRNFSSRTLSSYEKAWKHSFGKRLKAGLVFASLLSLGLQYKKLRFLFAAPNDKELGELLFNGKVSLRARLAFNIAFITGLFDKKKEHLPLYIRRIGKFFVKYKSL